MVIRLIEPIWLLSKIYYYIQRVLYHNAGERTRSDLLNVTPVNTSIIASLGRCSVSPNSHGVTTLKNIEKISFSNCHRI